MFKKSIWRRKLCSQGRKQKSEERYSASLIAVCVPDGSICVPVFVSPWAVARQALLFICDVPVRSHQVGCDFLLQGIVTTQDQTRVFSDSSLSDRFSLPCCIWEALPWVLRNCPAVNYMEVSPCTIRMAILQKIFKMNRCQAAREQGILLHCGRGGSGWISHRGKYL